MLIQKYSAAIDKGSYKDYNIMDKECEVKNLNTLISTLKKEKANLVSGEYTYLYHATY